EEWSDIAEAILGTVYQSTFHELIEKHGMHCHGSVLALGKLGARELNLSSDVDLIFIYENDNALESGVTNHEFHERLTVNLTKLLSEVTPNGFLYRVDHELRPEGKQGPLANSLDAAERYYQYFGQDWERQTLIRARPIAGDIALGDKFLECLTPFIYRRSVSLEDLSHMRKMKSKMEKEASLKHDAYNIKLGPGGIREAEFFVQALQQFYGGKYPKVRCNNTYDAIHRLKKESLIHPHTAQSLTDAYSFLRRTENMLQADEDLQVHRIPHKEDDLAALGRRMGFLDVNEFTDQIRTHTAQIERSFHALFEADYELQELEEAIRGNLESCSDDEERSDSLAWFRTQETKRIQHLDVNGKVSLQTALRRLTRVADVIIKCAWSLSTEELNKRYGTPSMDDGSEAGFAVIGMGRLGSLEMDYGSDLDLIFLYSGSGKTNGKMSISNAEFYTRLAQRIISLISLPTRYGKAYTVDPELRPSGRSGTLVATLESFRQYHASQAQVWERLSILKARIIVGDKCFLDQTKNSLLHAAYESPISNEEFIRSEIDKLRKRSIEERAAHKEHHIDLKMGGGGVNDLELIIRYLQLTHCKDNDGLNTQNSFDILDVLSQESTCDHSLIENLAELLYFHRLTISRLRLIVGRSTDVINTEADYLEQLATLCHFKDPPEMLLLIDKNRNRVNQFYNDTIKQSHDAYQK
ncbi:MAG: hypothetical protein HN337_00340, partial [Deltaproteobacteria bacterium]|nr:hypothetical protein [Deltaproteobacteria bacterium]